ncbi:lysosomal-trafficking regulator isoform X7 [Pteropus medius]|uniref:lysosomal-trafficking regulator isoform X7 n=1 Tax=Pteropus vampyrus TaxID=132908 RepID=UPI00196AA349|nr:lysosomal-trafficking regulator isoform X7 [Pteropus giganteus]
MSTDSNSLAREFLTDVNRLCNAVVQRAEAREEEEETHMATLGQYLVHGRGFLLLTKLNSTIDQALTCREELLTLLLSLLPLVWKIPVQEEKAADFNLPFSPGIILTKEKNSNSQRSAQEKLYLEGSAPSGQVPAKFSVFRKSRRQRKITHRYSVRDARKTQLSTSESEANSDDRSVAANKPRRPHQLPRSGTQSSREDGLAAQPARPSAKEQSPPGTMASESFQIMPGQAANADVLSEPAALSIISHMNNSPFDLCHVLLSLLEKVCKFDIALNHNSALAASVVPTLTEFLAGFGDCRHLSDNLESQMVAAGWTEEPVALIQRMLFRTALHLMSVDISTAETMPERLRKNLTELLRAALKIRTCPEKQPDPFAPRQKGTLQEVRESFVFSKCRHRALLLPELLEGVLQILVSCLQSAASNPSFFGQAVDLVQDFIQHHGFNLFETAVLQMEWLILRDSAPAEASEHLKALINGVLKIMSAVKRAKAEQLHHSVCPRKRHRRCEFAHFLHHHSDLSGLLASAFRNQVSGNPFAESADGDGDARPPARCCCVAVCAHRCLRTLQRASLSSTCVQILSGVHRVGVCCCMDPKSVIVPVLHALKLPALKNFQQPILNILNKLILDQLGGAEVSQKIRKAACNICTADSDQGAKLGEALALRAGSRDAQPRAGVPSPSCTFQGILPSRGSEDLLWKWDALEVYQSFVFEEDGLLSAPVAHHICSLLLKGNVAVQWKLYHCVLNPVLRRAVELAHHCRQLSVPPAQTHVCSHRNQCLPWEVLQIYLKTLPTLLKSRIIRDLFLSCNGVSQIIELNCLDGIRSHSLKAFETLIISLGEQREDSSISEISCFQPMPFLSLRSMCVDSNDDAKAVLLAQAESQENVFLPSKWQHLVLTYLQQPQGKKNVHGRMSMWVSGQRKPEVTLDFVLPRKTSLSSDSNKTFCMIGHCVSSQEEFLQLAGKWDLGNLLLFNGAKIGSQEAFYLYACGPNHTSIMPCKYGKPVIDYSKYINKEILQCEQIRELFMTKKDVDIGLLIESLSVVYTTYCPAQYTIYEPVIRLKGQAKTQLSQRPFSSKEVQSILLEPHHLKNLRPTQCQTIQGILHEIGGTGIFVFLFARVVELSSCEETQALALRIILSLVKYNQQRIHELENCNGLSMIHQVLIKQKCTVGFHVLKTLLEGCCGEDILHISENGEFRLDVESNAIIHDVKLLEALLLDWKIWRKAERGVWETLLAALGALIRAEHQQQLLNVRQLLEARVVHHFLLTCQVLQEHKEGQLTSMPREVCRSFVKIIAEVLGSPPDLELLTIIFNFLLAVHPPTNTYVCHNPTNFYFSLHIDGKVFQEKVESIMYLRHSSSGGKAVPSPGLVVISPSDFTASPPEGNSSSGITPPRTTADLRRSRSLPALPTSPLAQPQKLTGSSGGGIDSLQSTADRRVDSQPEKWGPLGTSETLKKGPEDAFVSSCESAKTVCETEAVLSVQVSVNGVPKGALEYPAVKVDPKEPGAEPRSDDDSPGDESCPRRPDYLKGLASFQRSHSMIASLGLAFPSQNGAAAIGRWPSLVDRNAEVWENVTFSLGYEPNCARTANAHSVMEDCLVPICCGLYELLSGVLLILPDAMLEDVMDKLIQADVLLVLVNHPSPAIQQGVIKLLDAYFNRASKEQKDKFLKNRGFSLLANQLYLHRGTQELLECFVEMFFGRHVGLDEEFDLEDVKNMGLFQKWSVIPILGLIETSLYDNVLLHNALLLLLQILNSCSKVADMLLDNGLLYVLCNTVAALNGLEKNIPLNEYKLLACDIQQLFIAVTIHACSSSGSQYFRVIEDLIVLLGYLQNSKNKRTQNMAVALQLRVLQAAMEFIRTTANHGCEHPADSLSLPSAPHHAVFQKRKSIAGSIPMKGSTVPHLPRRHFRSYGHLPMPFSSLNQDSCSPLCPGSTPCAAPPGAGPRKFPLAQTDSLLMKMRSVASDELHVMMQRRLSQENPVQASEAELAQRLQRLTVLAVNRIIYQDFNPEIVDILSTPEYATQSKTSVSQTETSEENTHREQPSIFNPFQKEILTYLVEGFKVSIASGKSSGSKQQWTKILGSCKDTFRMQLGRLLVHVVSPAHPSQQRKQIFEIVREPSYQEILRDCLSPSLQHGAKLVLYLSELIHNHPDDLTEEELDTAEVLMNALKLCGHKCLLPSASAKPELLKMIREEQKKYEAEEGMNKTAWQKTVNNNQQSLFQRLDSKSKDISKIAADITQAVSLSQGIERKKVIQHIRGMYKVDLSASRHWQELIQQLTHDRAVWYDPVYYPTSWQLDPTEGPNRERRRLQRCYLTIPNKYLLRERQKSEDLVRPPLSYLFEDKTHSSFSSTVKDKAASESIRCFDRVNRRCISVAPSRETAGELLLGKCGMYFVEDNASDAVESSSLQGELEPASFSWTYEEIKEVHKRWWQLRDNAVEIFLTNGRTLLLAFDNTKVRDDVYHSILTNNLPNLLEYGNITALTNLWYTGQITNFEYLTHLNKHAGRSFNDLMQYPVFPFILADYVSETLDLSDPAVYRNLSKPIAVQYKEKEDRYVDTYKYLEEEYRKGAREDDPLPPVQPYHYGSHYSNSGTVLHFLVRMPPFTRMFLAYQDQSFDIPDRTFHSTNTTWRLSSFESMTDVKELIPEFFYLPEFLVNREGFDFGVRQNGERVNHVNLPPWARNDPRLFILIHRQALESEHVSQNICQWIDLVFGYKQKGKASVQAINVFHPATYFGMDVSAVEDPVQRRALETMIKTYGQTPRQLFQAAHLGRPGARLSLEGELPAAVGLLVQLAFRESREQAKEITYPSPLPWIKGLKWGEYVGSPSAPVPVVCFSQPHGERFGSLQALPTRAICGLSRNFCLLMTYSKEQGVRSMNSTDIQWSAILSWGYADNILRLKSKQGEPPINFIQSSQQYQVTSCAWVPDSCQLFTGSKCGVITAHTNRLTSSTPSEIEMESQVHLYGHTAEITSLFVCKPYSIMISVSRDGTCIIWDLNRLCYVQSLAGHKSPVTAVSASETTGDVATVCDSAGGGSDLRLWTVNGDLVGHVHCREIVCSVAFSNQPEGVSINVIAGGLENGIVRLWSTWDLKPVREITFPKSNKPIVSLTFSCDGHHLYTANSEGTVTAWCRKDQQRLKQPMFYSFLSSYAAG